MKKYIAEFVGTFLLVFFGTGSIVIGQEFIGSIDNFGIALTFGLIVTIAIYLFASMSGGHFNPAVTIAFAAVKKFHPNHVLPYLLSQISGGIFASLILHLLFPENINLGNTNPSGSDLQSFLLEFFLTFMLLISIMIFSKIFKHTLLYAATGIGAVIFLEAFLAGPICGASMNPARSIAPALIAGDLENLWIYIAAPIFGAILAMLLWKKIID